MSEAVALLKDAKSAKTVQQKVQGHSAWQETLAGVLPFLVFGLGMVLYEVLPRPWVAGPIGLWCYVVLYIIGIVGLCVGWVKGFPRWSYAYAGLVLVIQGWWGDSDNLYGWYFIKPASQVLFWMMVAIALLLTRSLRLVGQFFKGIWVDWTLLSFAFYSCTPLVLLNLAYDFTTGNYPLPYPIASSFALAGGAWAYMRSRHIAQRAVALLAGMALTWMAAMVEVALYLDRTSKTPGLWSEEVGGMLPYWGWYMVSLLAPGLLGLLHRMVESGRANRLG
jgi:hypothetical protein